MNNSKGGDAAGGEEFHDILSIGSDQKKIDAI